MKRWSVVVGLLVLTSSAWAQSPAQVVRVIMDSPKMKHATAFIEKTTSASSANSSRLPRFPRPLQGRGAREGLHGDAPAHGLTDVERDAEAT